MQKKQNIKSCSSSPGSCCRSDNRLRNSQSKTSHWLIPLCSNSPRLGRLPAPQQLRLVLLKGTFRAPRRERPGLGICSVPKTKIGLLMESFARTSQFQIILIWKLIDPLWVVPQRPLVAEFWFRRREAAQEFLYLFAAKKIAVWFFSAGKNIGY